MVFVVDWFEKTKHLPNGATIQSEQKHNSRQLVLTFQELKLFSQIQLTEIHFVGIIRSIDVFFGETNIIKYRCKKNQRNEYLPISPVW